MQITTSPNQNQALASQSSDHYTQLVQRYEQRAAASEAQASDAGKDSVKESDSPAALVSLSAGAGSETAGQPADKRQLELHKQQVVRELSARDREVRAHEQAHLSAGGELAGNLTYEYVKGPEGRSYAVGGEVNIDTSNEPGDPEATLDKAEKIQRAALAPAEPSSQDRQVAAEAGRMELQAQQELAQVRDELAAADEALYADPSTRGQRLMTLVRDMVGESGLVLGTFLDLRA